MRGGLLPVGVGGEDVDDYFFQDEVVDFDAQFRWEVEEADFAPDDDRWGVSEAWRCGEERFERSLRSLPLRCCTKRHDFEDMRFVCTKH